MNRRLRGALVAASCTGLLAACGSASGVYLNADGLGQALIYPYYTVQSAGGNPFNTLLSVVNHTTDAKVTQVRFHEGRNGRTALRFHVYLNGGDTWTAALVPSSADAASPARIVTADLSCTNPPIPAQGKDFVNFVYTGSLADGEGDGLDRTREGYFEIIDLGTLRSGDTANLARNVSGIPANCPALQGQDLGLILDTPTGGLSGSLTLINVASGMDFTVNADALAALSSRPMYHALSSGDVDFNASEIDPVSQVVANGFFYRSVWSRPVDAVSAVLMRSSWSGEFILDDATRSKTDFVTTFPTREFYVTATSAAQPFTSPARWYPQCAQDNVGEPVSITAHDRETGVQRFDNNQGCGFLCPPGAHRWSMCAAASVFDARSSSTVFTPLPPQTLALGSFNRAFGGEALELFPMKNGWISLESLNAGTLASLPSSSRTNLTTGEAIVGAHAFRGLPVTGLWVRTFENGTLACSAGACQGNYGGSFPFAYTRSITP
ncbi:MAG: hypothetical protein ACXWHB_01465 [Usitatibacter sp.]